MKKSTKLAIYLFVLMLIVLYIIIYAVPNLTGALIKTEILQYKNFQTTDSATCYLVRDEKVYSAASSGTINYYIEDSVQVRKGTSILAIAPQHMESEESSYSELITRLGASAVSTISCAAEFNGIVSYYVDGYEGFFTPETMRELTYDQVKDLKVDTINVTRTSTLKGEPLYKICDNGKWYILCWVKPGNISKYELNKSVKIGLPAGEVSATVTDLIDNGDMWLVVSESNRYYPEFGKLRVAEATIVTSDYDGIVINNESLATEDDQVGVYVKTKSGDYRFTPVKVITSAGEETLVEVSSYYDAEGKEVGTVDIYDEILKRPEQAKDEKRK